MDESNEEAEYLMSSLSVTHLSAFSMSWCAFSVFLFTIYTSRWQQIQLGQHRHTTQHCRVTLQVLKQVVNGNSTDHVNLTHSGSCSVLWNAIYFKTPYIILTNGDLLIKSAWKWLLIVMSRFISRGPKYLVLLILYGAVRLQTALWLHFNEGHLFRTTLAWFQTQATPFRMISVQQVLDEVITNALLLSAHGLKVCPNVLPGMNQYLIVKVFLKLNMRLEVYFSCRAVISKVRPRR